MSRVRSISSSLAWLKGPGDFRCFFSGSALELELEVEDEEFSGSVGMGMVFYGVGFCRSYRLFGLREKVVVSQLIELTFPDLTFALPDIKLGFSDLGFLSPYLRFLSPGSGFALPDLGFALPD